MRNSALVTISAKLAPGDTRIGTNMPQAGGGLALTLDHFLEYFTYIQTVNIYSDEVLLCFGTNTS